jgi:hypothetical protein
MTTSSITVTKEGLSSTQALMSSKVINSSMYPPDESSSESDDQEDDTVEQMISGFAHGHGEPSRAWFPSAEDEELWDEFVHVPLREATQPAPPPVTASGSSVTDLRGCSTSELLKLNITELRHLSASLADARTGELASQRARSERQAHPSLANDPVENVADTQRRKNRDRVRGLSPRAKEAEFEARRIAEEHNMLVQQSENLVNLFSRANFDAGPVPPDLHEPRYPREKPVAHVDERFEVWLDAAGVEFEGSTRRLEFEAALAAVVAQYNDE